eukprot:CAMPEP_0182893068 /NCGR_PEP_ID=MMETSP0034_2-20130328/24251_1 /TAXON_ID=156128 /ORGANISM="Nephroselmis pyriformis, Strain CCMP717" /LENGTH=300 /DNA_ID=CAMNT_0025026787 /DNA_START=78 /DNA_END=980 /DNA_ORIENTATION=-
MTQATIPSNGVIVGTGDHDAAVRVSALTYSYPAAAEPTIGNMNLDLPAGSRCLLIGANGAGKSTLLQILGGKYMVGKDAIRVLGRPAFHDTDLTCSGDLSYLGGTWKKSVASAGNDVAMQGDITARQMLFEVEDADPARRDMLIDLLDVDLDWSMIRVSDGQRRRVQIAMGLLRPYKVLLLDEITVDLDVVGRLDLLDFFRRECEERGATIIYATHIFDGMEGWLSHIAYVANGALVRGGPVAEAVPELMGGTVKLLKVVEGWLREVRDEYKRKVASGEISTAVSRKRADPWASRHMAYY